MLTPTLRSISIISLISYALPLYSMDWVKSQWKKRIHKNHLDAQKKIQNPLYGNAQLKVATKKTTLNDAEIKRVAQLKATNVQTRHRSNTIGESRNITIFDNKNPEKLPSQPSENQKIDQNRRNSIEDSPALRRHQSEMIISTFTRKEATRHLVKLAAAGKPSLSDIHKTLLLQADPNASDIEGDTVLMRLIHQIALNKKKNNEKSLTNNIRTFKTIIENSNVAIKWDHKNAKNQTILSLADEYAKDDPSQFWVAITMYLNDKAPDQIEKIELVEARNSLGEWRWMPQAEANKKSRQRMAAIEKEQEFSELVKYLEDPNRLTKKITDLQNQIDLLKNKEQNIANDQDRFLLTKNIELYNQLERHIIKKWYWECKSYCKHSTSHSERLLQNLHSYFKREIAHDYEALQNLPERTREEEEVVTLYGNWKDLFSNSLPLAEITSLP